MSFNTLKVRRDFLWVRGGRRWATASLVLEGRRQPNRNNAVGGENSRELEPPRFGFTVTRKVGNAVVRNRIKRRLRETVRLLEPDFAKPGFDYVLVGRKAALTRPFGDMLRDLKQAFPKVHGKQQARVNKARSA